VRFAGCFEFGGVRLRAGKKDVAAGDEGFHLVKFQCRKGSAQPVHLDPAVAKIDDA